MRKIQQSLVLGALSILAVAASASTADAQCVPAFPGVEGAGRCTTGGRGGDVAIVTNTNTSGAGSLADAIANAPTNGRIIVFAVSGVIDVTTTDSSGNLKGGSLNLDKSNITIAGQTAPGDGITITGGKLMVTGSNIILRHIRSRRGVIRAGFDHGDSITIEPPDGGGTQSNIVVDHVSASWGTDESLSFANASASTLQWNLIAEGLNYDNAASNPRNHGYGSILASYAGTEVSFFHTLYAHNNRRNPHVGNYNGTGAPTIDFRNNVVYDWKDYASHNNGSKPHNINFVNNYYKSGPSSTVTPLKVFTFDAPSTGTKMYSSGNWLNGSAVTETTQFTFPSGTSWTTFQNATALTSSAYTTIATDQNYADVLEQSGTTLPARDIVDVRTVSEVIAGTGEVIDYETEVAAADWKSTYYESIVRTPDWENNWLGDGLPNYWEGQFVSGELTPTTDNDGDGYVNIEEHFNNTIPITIPTSGGTPKDTVVYVGSMDSRAQYGTTNKGKWRIYRSGPTTNALVVKFILTYFTEYTLTSSSSLTAPVPGTEGSITIPANKAWVDIELVPASTGTTKQMVLQLDTNGFYANPSNYVTTTGGTAAYPYFVGCPARALVRIK